MWKIKYFSLDRDHTSFDESHISHIETSNSQHKEKYVLLLSTAASLDGDLKIYKRKLHGHQSGFGAIIKEPQRHTYNSFEWFW